MYPMTLDEEEYKIISDRRKHLQYLKDKKNKQENCQHSWRCTGHSHNDKAYVCTVCGKVDFW